MGQNEIKAGGAYVEIGGKNAALKKALSEAKGLVSSFADGLKSIGQQMMLVGAGMSAPLIAAAKQFADAGDQIGKLKEKTGMGLQGLNGLMEAARQADVPIQEVATGMRSMMLNLQAPSKSVEEAFARLGTSAAELKKTTPEAALGMLADRFQRVTDLSEKTYLAQEIFKRGARGMLPILAGGSTGLNEMTQASVKLGTAFSDKALDSALRLDQGFKNIAGSMTGLRNAIGEAVEPALTPLIEGLKNATVAAMQWVEKNPEQVQAMLNLGLAIGAAGTAFVGLGIAISAAMSPAVLVTAAVAGIGMALLAVTDVLGVTDTGFGELFNSIRIGGTGLGTWFGAFFLWLEQQWNSTIGLIGQAWDGLVISAQTAGNLVWQAFVWVPKELLKTFKWMVDQIGGIFNDLASAWNAFAETWAGQKMGLGTIEMKFGSAGMLDDWIKKLEAEQNDSESKRVNRNRKYFTTQDDRFNETTRKNSALEKMKQELFAKDPQDASSGVRVDLDRAKDAIAGIGGRVGEMLRGLLGQIPTAIGYQAPKIAATPFGKVDTGKLGEVAKTKPKIAMESIGTFNAFAAERMGFGSSIQERAVKAGEETAKNTKQLLDVVRNNELVFD